MTGHRFYLDHNASAPLRPVARDAMAAAMDCTGNPSSIHGEGRSARAIVERARAQVATLVGAKPAGVIFTSGATEAAASALTPHIFVDGEERIAPRLYRSATEHPCVLDSGRFSPHVVFPLAVDEQGRLTDETLDAMFEEHDDSFGPLFVAVQLVNSETGIIQQVDEIARKVRLRGGFTLCDAVQAAGRMPIDIATLGVDFLMLSAHKIGGPAGVGALVLAAENVLPLTFIAGGGQEMRRRGGTENVVGIAGFGAAAEAAAAEAHDAAHLSDLRDSTEAGLMSICTSQGWSEKLHFYGRDAERTPNVCCFAVEGMDAQTALIAFDLAGVALSSGSACSSGKVGVSHVLSAMGVDADIAKGALRVSYGWNSTAKDMDAFLMAFDKILSRVTVLQMAQQQTQLSGAA
ncbi:cysteine desulfurase family protein [Ahrensia sp. R2A130]|uniref:cysteine desulfurase family protein n=1 Tax=Ahrensia sp. R2A130 TaxID=744979 RepID=UPI0001E0B44E|nr:cysteine desulfurase family protein [Ahrensia sp. R2A130]EFL90123.1 cysteine desulfurase [Ahrensia sp. R2A130]